VDRQDRYALTKPLFFPSTRPGRRIIRIPGKANAADSAFPPPYRLAEVLTVRSRYSRTLSGNCEMTNVVVRQPPSFLPEGYRGRFSGQRLSLSFYPFRKPRP